MIPVPPERTGRRMLLDPGRRYGRYEAVRFLGRGAQGETWLVYDIDERSAPKVAKLVAPGPRLRLATDTAQRRAIVDQQAQALYAELKNRRVRSQHVVQIYNIDAESFLIDGLGVAIPALLMEFLDGASPLYDALAGANEGTCLDVFAALAQGVADCHAAGVVHRDLSPHNVLVIGRNHRPMPVIIDFGTASLIENGATRLAGTPEYVPPDEIEIEDARSRIPPSWDVWSLGVMLAEIAGEGRHPFQAALDEATRGDPRLRMELVRERIRHRSPTLDAIRNARVRRIVNDCLSLDPCARPTAQELADALRMEHTWIGSELHEREQLLLRREEALDDRERLLTTTGEDPPPSPDLLVAPPWIAHLVARPLVALAVAATGIALAVLLGVTLATLITGREALWGATPAVRTSAHGQVVTAPWAREAG